MAAPIGIVKKIVHHGSKPKRTSIGRDNMPRNKSKRRSWKPYRGQGRP